MLSFGSMWSLNLAQNSRAYYAQIVFVALFCLIIVPCSLITCWTVVVGSVIWIQCSPIHCVSQNPIIRIMVSLNSPLPSFCLLLKYKFRASLHRTYKTIPFRRCLSTQSGSSSAAPFLVQHVTARCLNKMSPHSSKWSIHVLMRCVELI